MMEAQVEVKNSQADAQLVPAGRQQAVLTSNGIVFADDLVKSDDISGLEDGGGMLLLLHAYPKLAAGCSGKGRRRYVCCELVFWAAPEAKVLWIASYRQLWGRHQLCRLMVVVNPFSGGRRGRQVWTDVVEPVFQQAGVSVELVETTHAGHAVEIVRTRLAALPGLDGIVGIGGDGILSEIVQGLIKHRFDPERVNLGLGEGDRYPAVGIIPAGTGNGFAASHLFAAGEDCTPLCAALALARARRAWTDLALVTQQQVVYGSCLSWGWGLVSDTDIEADDLRSLFGPLRTTLKGVHNIVRRRIYPGRLQLLQTARAPDATPGWKTIEGNFWLVWAMAVTHAATDLKVAPHKRHGDGSVDVIVMREGVTRAQMAYVFLQLEKGAHIDAAYVEVYNVTQLIFEPLGDTGLVCIDGELSAAGSCPCFALWYALTVLCLFYITRACECALGTRDETVRSVYVRV